MASSKGGFYGFYQLPGSEFSCRRRPPHGLYLPRDDGVDGTFIETITLPRETMKKLNGMLYYHETKEGTFHPISLDDFIVLMVDELYEIRRDSYEERGNTLSQILEGVDVEQ